VPEAKVGESVAVVNVSPDSVATVERLVNEIDKTVERFPMASRTTTCALYAVADVNPVTAAVFAEANADELPFATAVP
jgi:hypothetical protein